MKHLLMLFFLTCSCSLTANPPRNELATPETWNGSEATNSSSVESIKENWWLSFKNQELNRLIDITLSNNFDLQAGLQRLEQARASAQIVSSDLWPKLSASGGFSNNQQHRGQGDTYSRSYRGQLAASYEIDLWGANRASSNAADARTDASRYDYLALKLVTVGEVVEDFANLLTVEERLRVARKNLLNATQLFSIIRARHQAGRTSALELAQQETALANTKAAISSLEYLKKSLHNQLAILTGQAPQSFSTEKTTISDFKIPPVETIEPSLLLTRRPDILSAEAALTAANFDVTVARTAFLPRFTIGIDSIIAANPASAPASIISGLASSVAAPLFQGGALQGELDHANARQSELLALYHATILRAYQDVEDSLAAVAAAQERTKLLKIAARQSELAHSLSQMRFEEGAIDFQALLDTQRSQLQADDALAQVKLEQIAATVSLYKALGGSWK